LHVLIDSTGLQVYGAGQWLAEKYGARSRRGWRKLHLALDADSGEIVAHTLTDQDTGDVSQVAPLLDQIVVRSDSLLPTVPMMESQPMMQSSITARRRLSSFRLAPMRSNQPTIGLPAKGTSISPQSAETAG
jgi:hypothetical protein